MCSLVVSSVINAMEEKVKKSIEWPVKQYAVNSKPQYDAATKVLDMIPFKPSDSVLDVGCGDGLITNKIAEKTQGNVKGIDSSLNMVNEAKKKYGTIPNLVFECGDITNYCDKQQYDYVFAFASFAWVKQQNKALVNIAKLLKSGGQFIAGIGHKDSSYLQVRSAMNDDARWKDYFVGYEIPYYPLNEDDIKLLCATAGLTVVRAEKGDNSYIFPTRQQFIDFMKALPAQINKIPEKLQEQFLNDIVDKYIIKEPGSLLDNGAIKLNISGLFLVARK